MRVLAAALVVGAVGVQSGDLPREIAGYRNWRQLTASAQPVSSLQWSLCRPLTAAEQERDLRDAEKERGPHVQYHVRVYASAGAWTTVRKGGAAFPTGAVLVKEKLFDPADRQPTAVAYMVKRTSGWEFGYRPAPENADYSGCVQCHRGGAARDFVFSRP